MIEINPTVILLGLPGVGISSIQKSLQQQGVSVREITEYTQKNHPEKNSQAWLVLNISEQLPPNWALSWLNKVLSQVQRIVFAFAEQASLEQQMAWQAWLKNQIKAQNLLSRPVVRWQNNQFPKGFLETLDCLKAEQIEVDLTKWGLELQMISMPVKKISLPFLWQGLEASEQNLGMQIYRITGKIQTLEYSHPVSIEGTASGIQVFPTNETTNNLIIKGQKLNPQLLKEFILASEV